MESKPNTIVASAAAPAPVPCNAIVIRDEAKPPPVPTKKKHGAMHLLRAALFMIRRGSGKKSKTSLQIEVGANGMLNKVVGSMRPLHMQSHESPLHEAAAVPAAAVLALPSPGDHFVDVFPASPMSAPSRPYSPSHSSTSGSTSRYASAVNLQELVEGESDDEDEDEDDGGIYCTNGGDDMIDAKAEEFIAQFYQQMKAQNYNEMIRRRGKGHAP
ncbi:uncharacterized protein LOC115742529 [Rhodamnia argentea]|uniref:Uncharacterized protein LOC115742529 n=1 Tax=Rhodamnia argentea TaxID=178133 RepID=A0A8B8PDV1_9MYRT|nr:uncharacterized protein LOC115742529 [Rhodamnia argentea]